MKKQRKPLNDALAHEFIYGKVPEPQPQPEAVNPPEPEAATANPPEIVKSLPLQKETSLMYKLQLPEKEPTVRFTVDLSQSLHRKLSVLAAKTGQKKADIVRLLLEEVLEEVEE